MTFELLARINLLFAALFVLGTALSLQLYHWDRTAFFRSSLWTKIVFWVPIYIAFVALLYLGGKLALIITALLAGFAVREILRQPRVTLLGVLYGLLFIAMFAHILGIYWLGLPAIAVLIVICFSSVLSDIHAYFFGSFFGAHKLPAWINPGKSWEGVLGQIIGALTGYVLVASTTGLAVPPWPIALVIGIGSAAGDIVNSIVKRTMRIKDWGNTIPGHGGVLDRFASLGFAISAAVWYLVLMGPGR